MHERPGQKYNVCQIEISDIAIMFVWAEGYKVVRMMPIALEKGTYGLPEKEQLVQTNFI